MLIYIQTHQYEFYKDFYDILKIFINNVDLYFDNPINYDMQIKHIVSEFENEYNCEFVCIYNKSTYRHNIVFKRIIGNDFANNKEYKKTNKLCLYHLLKDVFGKKSPWGALTGVRPTCLSHECIEKGMSKAQTLNFLVNKYDLDMDKAELLYEVANNQKQLQKANQNEVDIYLSIPFCKSKCAYCTFPSNVIDSRADDYLNALVYEMQEIRKVIDINIYNIRSVYIGGGTPTSLNEKQLEKLLYSTKNILLKNICVEFTLEAGRPDTINNYKLNIAKAYGINRISINPQTMSNSTLKRIGRQHTAQDIINAYEAARKIGFNNINMDIIAGLPEESLLDFRNTLLEIEKLKPQSLTIHTLALKRNSVLTKNSYFSDESDVVKNMILHGENTAKNLNMIPYYLYRQKNTVANQQNIGYSQRGFECLYNIDIMEESISILALGAGAISKLIRPNIYERIKRVANVSELDLYIKNIDQMIARKQNLFNSVEEKQ